MSESVQALFEAARASIGLVGLRTRSGVWGELEGHEEVRPTHTWFLREPRLDLDVWDRLAAACLNVAQVEKRNAYLERDNAALDRAEVELRRSYAQAWALFDATPACMFVESADGRFLSGNRCLEAIVQRDREDLIGGLVDDYLPWLSGVGRRERATETGSAITYEAEFLRGETQTVFLCTSFPLPGQDGEVQAVGTIMLDITQRRAAKRGLEASERSYREVFENASDLILIQDEATGTIMAANQGIRALGWEPAEVVGWRFSQISATGDELSPQVPGGMIRADVGVAWPLLGRDGSTHWYQLKTTRTNFDGQVRLMTVARDVTRERLEEERRLVVEEHLHRAQKFDAIGRLANGISHEFNNLLSVIVSHSELLTHEAESEPIREDIQAIREAADRAAGLIRKLMVLGRRRHSTPPVLDVGRQLEVLRDLVTRGITKHRVLAMGAPTGFFVRMDPAQLDRVVVNLLDHSRQSGSAGGYFEITLRAATEVEAAGIMVPRAVAIEVVDTGRGHTPEELERLYEPFWTGVDGDSQIGMATALSTVVYAGGTILTQATAGQTRFTVVLPACDEEAVEVESKTVLLADDDASVLVTLRKALEYRGWRVLSARSGEEALNIAARSEAPVDILVTDVLMPTMSGPMLAQRLRKEHPGLPGLFMSGYLDAAHMREIGEAHVVMKPFSTSQLLEAIERNLKDA